MPVDLFLEKRRMKRVPHIMKLRDGFGSVCRIRVRLWLEPRTEDDIEPSEFHLAAVDDDDDDDEGDDDGNSSAMELGGEGDDEFGSRNPPPPVNFPPVYEVCGWWREGGGGILVMDPLIPFSLPVGAVE